MSFNIERHYYVKGSVKKLFPFVVMRYRHMGWPWDKNRQYRFQQTNNIKWRFV